jgi:dihydroorotate dehydrogenase electron transfer subunit
MFYQEHFKISSNREVNPGVQLLWIKAPEIASAVRPGQFVMLSCDDSGQRLLRRPLSVHQVKGDRVAFLLALVGEGTRWLAGRKAGQEVDLLGPLGNGFDIGADPSNLLLVAGGLGIAPLVFLAQAAARQGHCVRLLYGARTQDLLYHLPHLPREVQSFAATDDGSAGQKGPVTALVPPHLAWADRIFICGPLAMYRAIAKGRDKTLLTRKPQVSLELRMACGLGFCYACTIKTKQGLKQVCKDGPVFALSEVEWEGWPE